MQNTGIFIAGHYPIEIIDEIGYPQREFLFIQTFLFSNNFFDKKVIFQENA
jgi:hypothetical protein